MIKNRKEINAIKKSCLIVREAKEILKENIKEGISLKELDKIAYDFIISKNAKPSFLGYEGFPASICTSINDILVHGIPNNYVLQKGDLISIDIGVYYKGFHGDSAFTKKVGKITKKEELLLQTTRECLEQSIKVIKDGVSLGEVGRVIERHAKKHGFYITKDYAGHGIGSNLHEPPYVFNFEDSQTKNYILKAGEIIAIEPMLLIDSDEVYVDSLDDWSVRSKNNKKNAHEEHTILVTKDGCEVLT